MDGVHLLPTHGQHGVPVLAAVARAGHLAGPDQRVLGRLGVARHRAATPTRGKKETTDHPPIYPTQAVHPGALEGPKKRVYELVVRRFLATFSPPMITESTRPTSRPGRRPTSSAARSSSTRLRRHLHLRPLGRRGDPETGRGPDLRARRRALGVDKETQPPARISQAKLIEMMEERGLGTKATRADIIQKLFDRGYVYGNPPVPSETGIALYEAFKNYVPAMATPEMTAQLEAEMDRIAAGEMTKGAVVGESRELLHRTWSEIDESREDLAKSIWKGMDEDRILGPCKVCEEGRTEEDGSPHMLRIIRAEKIGQTVRRLQRLDRRHDPHSATQSVPLPQRGDVRPRKRCRSRRDAHAEVAPFRGGPEPWPSTMMASHAGTKKRRPSARRRKRRKRRWTRRRPHIPMVVGAGCLCRNVSDGSTTSRGSDWSRRPHPAGARKGRNPE